MNIRKEISDILGFTIPSGKWEESFDSLEKEGRITRKHIIQILLLLIKREEKREDE